VFLLAHPKGTLKKGKGKGKEEFPEHWIFPLLLAKEREKGKCNQASKQQQRLSALIACTELVKD